MPKRKRKDPELKVKIPNKKVFNTWEKYEQGGNGTVGSDELNLLPGGPHLTNLPKEPYELYEKFMITQTLLKPKEILLRKIFPNLPPEITNEIAKKSLSLPSRFPYERTSSWPKLA